VLGVRITLAGALLVCAVPAQGNLQDWLDEIKTQGADATPELIHKIARLKTRAALTGLISVYDTVPSVYVRREVVRALAVFDGVAEAEQPALEKMANVATGAKQPELRQAAVASLAGCMHLGKHFLAVIVESKAFDDVRVQAMRAHIKQADKADAAWYRRLWVPPSRRTKYQPDLEKRTEHHEIRELAFGAIATNLPDKELVDLLENETNPKIRRGALAALHAREAKATQKQALKLLKSVDASGIDRARAAEILAAIQGPKIGGRLLALAKKRAVTQADLRQTIARLLVEMNDKATNKKLARLVGRGRPHEKVFALLATVHLDNPKLLKKIRTGLADRSFEVRRTTARVLAERGDRGSLPALMAILDKPITPGDLRVAIEAVGTLKGNDTAWTTRLKTWIGNADRDMRNAALSQLATSTAGVDALVTALQHADWTTRLIAIKGLEALRDKRAVPALINVLAREEGRMKVATADALWSLTAKVFEDNVSRWQTWWDKEGNAFSVISQDDLKAAAKERELRRLRQTTVATAKFFGIRIVSHRVIFIIDTSGSMVEPVPGHKIGKRVATRIEIAKRELLQCIDNLEPNALFNIFAFSSGLDRWVPKSLGVTSGHTRDKARVWVERLGAGGGTNLYDSIQIAFGDPDVDTIFIMSDGEPTVGEVIDQHRIRENVKFWNKNRGIKLHTIAVGGSLEVLEWLAKDSGGRYVMFR
jgi:hypothetical protein